MKIDERTNISLFSVLIASPFVIGAVLWLGSVDSKASSAKDEVSDLKDMLIDVRERVIRIEEQVKK